MSTPFKMKGMSFQGSPMKQDIKELPLTHSDTTTTGNPVNPSMISFLGRQGLTKGEINALHKAHERKLKKKKK